MADREGRPRSSPSGFEKARHGSDDEFHAIDPQLRKEGQGEHFATRAFGLDEGRLRRVGGESGLLMQSAWVEDGACDALTFQRFRKACSPICRNSHDITMVGMSTGCGAGFRCLKRQSGRAKGLGRSI